MSPWRNAEFLCSFKYEMVRSIALPAPIHFPQERGQSLSASPGTPGTERAKACTRQSKLSLAPNVDLMPLVLTGNTWELRPEEKEPCTGSAAQLCECRPLQSWEHKWRRLVYYDILLADPPIRFQFCL